MNGGDFPFELVVEARSQFANFLRASCQLRYLSVSGWMSNGVLCPFYSYAAHGTLCEAEKEWEAAGNANGFFDWPPCLVALDCHETQLGAHDLVQLARQCGPHLQELAFDIADYGTGLEMGGDSVFAHAVNQLLGSFIRFSFFYNTFFNFIYGIFYICIFPEIL
jgi:hypothetical protein